MKIVKTLLLTLAIIIIGSTVSPITAYAGLRGGNVKGSEDASNLDDFDGDISAQNEFKIWSVCKSLGLSDEQAAGIMGCWYSESGLHAETVETYCDQTALDGSCSEDLYNEYVKNHSEPFAQDNDGETVKALKRYKGVTDAIIASARVEGSDIKVQQPTFKLSISHYFTGGIGYLGVGLAGYTNGRCKALLEWSKDNKVDWYNIDNQLIWALTKPEDGGDTCSAAFEQYKKETEGANTDTCTEWWAHHYESAGMSADWVAARAATAAKVLKMFKGMSWDQDYGEDIVSGAGLQPSGAKKGIVDKSILFSYASNVIKYPLNSGFLLNIADNKSLDSKNQKVYKGYIKSLKGKNDTSKKYSLYELFGEDLHWYRYMGEATYVPNLLDHIWSAVDTHKASKLVSVSTIDYNATNYLSCHVYENRPDVLTVTDTVNGYNDPRVLAFSNGWFNGYNYVLGNIGLSISKTIVSLVSLLLGHQLMDTFVDILNKIESTDSWKLVQIPALVIVGIAMIAFIMSIVGKATNYAVGRGAAKDAISRFLVGFVCLGLLFAALYNPKIFNTVIVKGLTAIDQVFEASLASSLKNDEIISVSDDDMIVQAVLWKTGIFNAWCRGQFDGLEYNELYTNYATTGKNQKAMPQSNDEIDLNDTTGKAFYNSTELTGDVVVPIGGNTLIRNWAAYLYSCGSKYHIDTSIDAKTAEDIDTTKSISFPNALTTAYDSSIMADTFRVIDAQMDISPQYYADGTESKNYANAKKLKPHYVAQGTIMVFNTALLLLLIPPIYKKISSFILLLILTIQMIYFTIAELFKEDAGIKDFFESFKKSLATYVVASVKINIMIMLYATFVDKGFFMTIIYVVLCITVLGFNIQDTKRFISNAKHNIQQFKQSF